MTEQKPNKLKRILFPILGVVVAVIAIIAVAVQLGSEEPSSVSEPDFHETAEKGTPLVVNFAKPATTDAEYALLYAACAQYMESQNSQTRQEPVVDVTEDTFIDAEDASEPTEIPEPDGYAEYDRAYFDDFLMVRYVSQSGEICVVGARLEGEDRTETVLLVQENFNSEHFSADLDEEDEKGKAWQFLKNSGTELEEELEEELEKNGSVSEETFVSCVGQCVLDILSKTGDEERIRSHFTEEGGASLLRIMQVLEIGENCPVTIALAEVGASAPDLETMDRLYLRCELTDGEELICLNLLLKLNGSMAVYDVDLI